MTFRAVFETLPLVELPDYKGLRVKARRAEGRATRTSTRRSTGCARRRRATTRSRAAPTADGRLRRARPRLAARRRRQGRPRRERPHRDRRRGQPRGHERRPRGHAPRRDEGHRGRLRRGRRAKRIAGKTVHYTVTLKGIKKKVVPAADDEFAKDLGDSTASRRCGTTIRQRLAGRRGAPRRPRDEGRPRRGARGQRPSFEVPEALVERHMIGAHRERRPRPRLPGHRPAQDRGGLAATTARRSARTR